MSHSDLAFVLSHHAPNGQAFLCVIGRRFTRVGVLWHVLIEFVIVVAETTKTMFLSDFNIFAVDTDNVVKVCRNESALR